MATFHLCWPDEALLRSKGFERVAHVPFVFDDEWKYQRDASNYLVDRALGESGGLSPQSVLRGATKESLRTFGAALCNFLAWCAESGHELSGLRYRKDLHEGYQAQMQSGKWSERAVPLSARTINSRVDVACLFLKWLARRENRSEFEVPVRRVKVRISSAKSTTGRVIEKDVRVGKVRLEPSKLRLPSDESVLRWLNAVRIQRGETKALMCDLVVGTGVRKAEAVGWRVDTLPLDKNRWERRGDGVLVDLTFGTKGADQGPIGGSVDGDKLGPPRAIVVPLRLAERLHHYREFVRPHNRAVYVQAGADTRERRTRMSTREPHLFLSDSNGRPVSASSFYEAWCGVTHHPFDGFSPHLGRHYWACKTLLLEALKRIKLLSIAPSALTAGWIDGNASSDIDLLIRPQLGHVNAATSSAYVSWVRHMLAGDLHEAYAAKLDEMSSGD